MILAFDAKRQLVRFIAASDRHGAENRKCLRRPIHNLPPPTIGVEVADEHLTAHHHNNKLKRAVGQAQMQKARADKCYSDQTNPGNYGI